MYFYIKALHIIFIITWFSGMFYIVRLFIYSAEADVKEEPERSILLNQFSIMKRRLWYGITWPSAILTLIFGSWTWILLGVTPQWLIIKLCFVAGLYIYHFSLQKIFVQQQKENFSWSSQKLRIWNEVATLFLIAIVMLAVVKQLLSLVWAVVVLVGIALLLFIAINLYKRVRRSGED